MSCGSRRLTEEIRGLPEQAAIEDFAGCGKVVFPFDFRSSVAEAIADLLQGIACHVGAAIAGAGFPVRAHDAWYRDVGMPWGDFLEGVDHGGLGGHEEGGGIFFLLDELPHAFGAADDVREFEDVLGAFRVGEDTAAGVIAADANQILNAEDFVDHAGAGPEDHVASGGFLEVASEVLIGDEENFEVCWDAIDNFAGVATRYDPVAEAFDGGRGVDVGDSVESSSLFAELLLEGGELAGRAAVGE